MFTPLHNSMNQELFEKYACNQGNHYGAMRPVIIWNWSIHCPSLSAMFNLLHSSINQELFEKHLRN